DERQKNARQAHACGQHRHDFIRARHSPQRKKERKQKGNRQEDDENLRNLSEVILDGEKKTDALVDKGRNVVANVKDEPDRDKTRDAVKIDLQKIANDVAIEEPHYDLDSPVLISVVNRARTRKAPNPKRNSKFESRDPKQRRNDKIRMTKLERMTNDQMPNDCDIVSSSFGLCASFVIRHSCFVISCWMS